MNKAKRDSSTELSPEIEMMRIISLADAARLAGVSVKTLRSNHADKVIKISKNRIGMRVRDALMIKESDHAGG